MAGFQPFLLDSNIFIEARRRYYAFDICPGYWSALIGQFDKGTIFSLDRVFDEMAGKGDELADWVENTVPANFFHSSKHAAIAAHFAALIAWVQGQPFQPAAKAEFATVADGWLIAFALANGYRVVTHEVADPNIRRKVPMPNVCDAFGVKYVDTFEMLRELGVSFDLA